MVSLPNNPFLLSCLEQGGIIPLTKDAIIRNIINRLSAYIYDDNTDLSVLLKVTTELLNSYL